MVCMCVQVLYIKSKCLHEFMFFSTWFFSSLEFRLFISLCVIHVWQHYLLWGFIVTGIHFCEWIVTLSGKAGRTRDYLFTPKRKKVSSHLSFIVKSYLVLHIVFLFLDFGCQLDRKEFENKLLAEYFLFSYFLFSFFGFCFSHQLPSYSNNLSL